VFYIYVILVGGRGRGICCTLEWFDACLPA